MKTKTVVSETKHALTGKQMTGAEVVVQVLADEGVTTVFGYSGGAILPTYDAIFRRNQTADSEDRINLIVPANEQGAGFMAAGYAGASGEVGVLLVTSGPGATNCVTPIRDCISDSVPVVMLCGQVARGAVGTDAFQEAPVFNVMSACAKHVFLVSDESKLESTIRTAFEIARSGRPGPVVIDLPKDVQNANLVYQGTGNLNFPGYASRRQAIQQAQIAPEHAKTFFDMLSQSNRPLIMAGGGVICGNASAELRAFVDRFKIPVTTTLMGIGSLSTTDNRCLHLLGMHGTPYANYAVDDCDFLISIGARFDDRVAGNVAEFAKDARIAHIDIDSAEIGKVKKPDWSHVGDAKHALLQLMEAGKQFKKDFTDWGQHCLHLKQNHPLNFNRESTLIEPEFVLETLDSIVKGEAFIVTGVGQHQMWAAQYLTYRDPRSWITSGSMGTMGFGLPAAIGAKVAFPDKTVIDIDGDGSLRMNFGDFETPNTYNIGVKILLLNNSGDGMVRQWQDLFFDNRYSGTDKTLHKKDFVKAAEADGYGFARSISKPEEVRSALEEFVAWDGAAFLEVKTNPRAHVYPMVGPGQAYRDMIVGKYMNARDIVGGTFNQGTDGF